MTATRYIKSIYRISNDEMLVYRGPLNIVVDGTNHVRAGQLIIDFSSRPVMEARFAGGEGWMYEAFLNDDPTREINVPVGAALDAPKLLAETELDAPQVELVQRLNRVAAGDFSRAVRLSIQVLGRLTNLSLPPVQTPSMTQGQVSFALSEWDLVLARSDEPTAKQTSFIIEAKPRGGRPISVTTVELLSQTLHRLLSFLAGSNVGVVPIVGLDNQDEIVAAQWAAPRVDFNRSPMRWCYEGDFVDALVQLAEGRSLLDSDPVLAMCLDRAISLHLAGNGQEVLEVRLPVVCSGLELMAWSVLQQHGWLNSRATRSLTAGERAQLLLKWAGIPTDLPTAMDALSRRRKNLGQILTAVELAINVRNKVVHPPDKIQSVEWPTGGELFEAWQLTTWHLELAILRLLKYQGPYVSRLRLGGWNGSTEPVPWLL